MKWEKFSNYVFSKSVALKRFGRHTFVQCNSYGSLNVRRAIEMIQFYKRLYNEKTVFGLWINFSKRWPQLFRTPAMTFGNGATGGLLLSASLFSFTVNGIADEEMINAARSLADLARENRDNLASITTTGKNRFFDKLDCTGWELLTDKNNFYIWRRPSVEFPSLFEYRCAGTFYDVPAVGFYFAQIDLDYRKQWDRLVIVLDVVDSDSSTGSEVVRWVTHFPFPMYPREYVYVRRSFMDAKNKTIVLTSKTVDHQHCPKDEQKYVRVEKYYSCMVIKPHTEFEEDGLDYVLTYFDDPKSPFPTTAYNWMVTTGVPGFVDKVYKAAKTLAINKTQFTGKINQQSDCIGASVSKNYLSFLPSSSNRQVFA